MHVRTPESLIRQHLEREREGGRGDERERERRGRGVMLRRGDVVMQKVTDWVFQPALVTRPPSPTEGVKESQGVIESQEDVSALVKGENPRQHPPVSQLPEEGIDWDLLSDLSHCLSVQPGIRVLDPVMSVKPFLDRRDMSTVLSDVVQDVSQTLNRGVEGERDSGVSVSTPPLVNLPYPGITILKPFWGCGPSISHSLQLCAADTSLSLVDKGSSTEDKGCREAVIAMPFLLHSTVYKVYMIGDSMHVICRDVSEPVQALVRTLSDPAVDTVPFNSQSFMRSSPVTPHNLSEAELSVLRKTCLALSARLNVSMLGIDVILDRKGDREREGEGDREGKTEGDREGEGDGEGGSSVLSVVDVNYCPGFKSFPDFNPTLFRHLFPEV
ncbi:inositol-tetrakisphosphate 1-kinase [Kipferlia bialata]|uniref:Inositol-tetrakisphosphate 1-kinase n=1 Tax=Kipferlia bialata TaxID=797122 RepID=A0A9K3CNS2_9EUKA|nr:inositol-tetrakisphosphate 1-kinase [Kipferlia bialata]GIQ81181.1 inositol-tetrakisphosphate 1-kinase [Kipferlia bialata]|eukprot:g261.t1